MTKPYYPRPALPAPPAGADLFTGEAAVAKKPLSLGARRTLMANKRIEQGIHPANGAAIAEPRVNTCGQCWHAIATQAGNHGDVWKCELGRLSHSETTDIRLKWPACTAFSKTDDGKSEGTPGWVSRRGAKR